MKKLLFTSLIWLVENKILIRFMEITFNDLRSREIINIYDGKRLGRAIDIVFDKESSVVLGLTVPGQSKLFSRPGSGGAPRCSSCRDPPARGA